MNRRTSLSLVLLFLCSAAACGNSKPSPGTERGDCYPNGSCNAGLACMSGVCVSLTAPAADATATAAVAPKPAPARAPAPAPAAPPPAPAPAPAPTPPPPAANEPPIDVVFGHLADEVCACKDERCYFEVQRRMDTEAEHYRDRLPPDEHRRRMQPFIDRAAKCGEALSVHDHGDHGDYGDPRDVLHELERLADDTCACKDAECLAAENKRVAEFNAKHVNDKPPADQMRPLMDRMLRCSREHLPH